MGGDASVTRRGRREQSGPRLSGLPGRGGGRWRYTVVGVGEGFRTYDDRDESPVCPVVRPVGRDLREGSRGQESKTLLERASGRLRRVFFLGHSERTHSLFDGDRWDGL